MRRLLSFALLLLSTATFAQHNHTHACAKGKAANLYNIRQARAAVSRAHTELMNKYDVHFYKLDINLDNTSTYISGNVTIKATVVSNILDNFGFELHPDLDVDSVVVNGIRSNFTRSGSAGTAPIIVPVSQGNEVEVVIYYNGTPPSGASAAIGNGMSNDSSPTWGNQVTWSLSQPFAAHEWWPCKQVLGDKADSVYVFITTPDDNKVGSNGLLTASVNLPNNMIRYEWKSYYPIAYYLVSVSVSEYVDYTVFANPVGSSNPIPIQNYVYDNPQTLPNFQSDIDETVDMMELFAELFGPYPFQDEKYGHSMAPFSGGMEHQTMTTQGFFEFGLTAHELGHQWWGDQVTCGSWEDIWLNEGFATYSEQLAYEYLYPGSEVNNMQNIHDFVMQSATGSVYVADTTDSPRIFSSRLTYNKGAALVHMIRYMVDNDTLFWDILKSFQTSFKFDVARMADFKNILENMSGQDFTDFFNEWYFGEGFPVHAVEWNHEDSVLYIQNEEFTTASGITPHFNIPLEYTINRVQGDTTVRVLQDSTTKRFIVDIEGTITGIELDEDNWVLNWVDTIFENPNLRFTVPVDTSGPIDTTDPNGIQFFNASNVKVFPNPTNNVLTVVLPSDANDVTIELLDITGKAVISEQVQDYVKTLYISHLPVGLYHIQISDGIHQPYGRKIIKAE